MSTLISVSPDILSRAVSISSLTRVIPGMLEAVGKMAKQPGKNREIDFCYEASGCGYSVHRQLTGLWRKCIAVAPYLIPRKSGECLQTSIGEMLVVRSPAMPTDDKRVYKSFKALAS